MNDVVKTAPPCWTKVVRLLVDTLLFCEISLKSSIMTQYKYNNTLLAEIDSTLSTEPTTTTTKIVERRRIVDSSEGSSNTNTNTEHTEATTSQTIDALLAKELNALSFQ